MPYTLDDYVVFKKRNEEKMNEAAAERKMYAQQADACRVARNKSCDNIARATSQKINFEKRIQDIIRIIKLLKDMDTLVSEANKRASQTDNSYSNCIKCFGSDIQIAKFAEVFKLKSVSEDLDISNAIDKLEKEKKRLENEVESLNNSIKANEQNVLNLQKQIAVCDINQMRCTSTIASCIVRADFCKNRINSLQK